MDTFKNELIASILKRDEASKNLWLFSVSLTDTIAFNIRPLDISTDISTIHQWVNAAYAIPFWQMNSSLPELEQACLVMLNCSSAHTLIGCLNDQPICQVDIYDPFFDEVGKFYPVQNGDIGIHLLIGTGRKPVSHFSDHVLLAFMQLLFQSSRVHRIIAEPDENNRYANRLLKNLSFHFEGCLRMPHKTASLYSMANKDFWQLPSPFPITDSAGK